MSTAVADPTSPLPEGADVRLVVVDMDGTLLDGEGRIPEDLWPLLEAMRERGVVFSPASGRQYATLARQFDRAREGMVFIAENGSYVVSDEAEISSTTLAPDVVARLVGRGRDLTAQGHDLGMVVCGKRAAYVERTDRAFLDHVDPYYASLVELDDLDTVDDDVVKVAVFSFADPQEGTAPALADFGETHQVVVSGAHWVDVMHPRVDKGVAVRRLQEELGVSAEQTVAFGDYLNDLEMLDAAGLSFAMDNAHPEVLARARYRAPSHLDHGVITTLRRLLGL